MTRRFLVCLHDSSPAFAREMESMIRDLAPLVGRTLSVGVVPNWHGQWPLASHPDYCRWLRENADELLLHGCFHRRRRGGGPVTWLTNAGDEMNGLTLAETERTLAQGQAEFSDAFGEPARGFIAPAWQLGRVPLVGAHASGLSYTWKFFSIESRTSRIPVATWTWDCGRWGWLGHLGHGVGHVGQFIDRGLPVLAIHPRDLQRGFWPKILRLIEELRASAYEPATPTQLQC
jgi:predicted deacetylase